MGDEVARPTAGWYRNGAGQKQWWDGDTWGPLAPEPHGPGPALGAAWDGAAQITPTVARSLPQPLKSTGVAYLLLLLFAGFGAHRFYLNAPGWALIFIASCAVTSANLLFVDQPGPFLYIAGGVYLVLILIDLCTLPMQVRVRNEELMTGRSRHHDLTP